MQTVHLDEWAVYTPGLEVKEIMGDWSTIETVLSEPQPHSHGFSVRAFRSVSFGYLYGCAREMAATKGMNTSPRCICEGWLNVEREERREHQRPRSTQFHQSRHVLLRRNAKSGIPARWEVPDSRVDRQTRPTLHTPPSFPPLLWVSQQACSTSNLL